MVLLCSAKGLRLGPGGLEVAQKRQQDVTPDLDNFDKRMDDLLHIATNFNYPEDWMIRGRVTLLLG